MLRLLTAAMIGAIIGLEREIHGKVAGLRTNMLMCIGSCLIMIISIEISRLGGGSSDPGRIAAQVVTGVGFLGAGAIIRAKFQVTGLTTAATIWVLSGLGLAVGMGYYKLSIVAALLITATLTLVRYVERAITRRISAHTLRLVLDKRAGIVGTIIETFTRMKILSEALDIQRTDERWTATFEYTAQPARHRALLEELSRIDGVIEFSEK